MVKLQKIVKVKNPMGLHARPATAVVRLLQTVSSSVFFTYRKQTVNAKSIMSLLMLAAAKNAQITVTIDGEDAQEALGAIEALFENQFGEGV